MKGSVKTIIVIGVILLVIALIIGGVFFGLFSSYAKSSYVYEQSGNAYLINIRENNKFTATKVEKGTLEFLDIDSGTYTKDGSTYTLSSKSGETITVNYHKKVIAVNGKLDGKDLKDTNFTKAKNTLEFMKILFRVSQGK